MLLVSNYMIYITLWSLRLAILGCEAKLLPALREAAGRRSLQPRTLTMDVVEGAGKPRAGSCQTVQIRRVSLTDEALRR